MGFSSVYRSLQEIFPELDARLLRAVAIEHPKDADLAVEVVLTEVLPYMSKHSNASSTQSENQRSRDPSGEGVAYTVEHAEEDGEPGSSLIRRRVNIEITVTPRSVSSEENTGTPRSISSEDSNDVNPTGDANHALNESVVSETDCRDELILLEKAEEISDKVGFNHGANVVDHFQVSVNTESKELNPLDKYQEMNIETGTEQTTDVKSTILVHEDEDACVIGKLKHLNLEDFDEPVAHDFASHQLKSSSESSEHAETDVTQQIPASVEGEPDAHESGLQLDSGSVVSDCDKQDGSGSSDCNSNQVCSDCGAINIDDESALVSRSGQICKVDFLEGIIEDAKNNKKTLFSAMESVINMMKEVELKEKAVEQAKEEAAKGDLDILVRVEELKQMLVHAKEANDMHAGEVYGEKAILATEVRELQSRLLNLSDERDSSLAILNEMRETLESRLASAEEMMRAALMEKQEKEESARKALAEQEAIMEKVVQESKILQQEAEENSKLQEFLMDRGRVVDMLQGEISVICQDVRLLKERFDERVPLSQSVTSSQTTCKLASSSSSLKSVASDVDSDQGSSRTPKKTSPTPSTNGQSPKSPHEEDKIRNDHKALLDDGWDLFDNLEEFVSHAI